MKLNRSATTPICIERLNSTKALLRSGGLLIVLAVFGISASATSAADLGGLNSPTADLGWSIVSSPRKAGVKLYGVSVFSPTQAWAVGDIYSPLTPIIYRWNGTAWGQVSAGNIPDCSLRDVVSIAANDAWAVGYQEGAGGDADLTVTQHWDGAKWTRIPSPNPSDENYINAVAAVATNDVWAVGQKGTSTLYGALILHWDGTAWTESPTRGGGYRVLTDVATLAANDVWAIGYKFSFNTGYQGLAMHWNGARWSDVALPLSDNGYTLLNGLTVISPTDIWAVGQSGGSPIKPLTVHWDGTAWTYVSNPPLPTDYAFLKGITALASDDVWAVGYFTGDDGVDRNLVEHWNGLAWTQATVPEVRQAHNELWAITPDRAGGLWTVGSFLPSDFSRPLSSLVLRASP